MLRVTTQITGGTGGNQWSTHFFDGTTAGEADVAAQAVTNFWEELSSHIHSSYTFQVIGDVDFIDPLTGLITGVESSVMAPVVGDAVDNPLPWANQGLIRWRTGAYEAGREIRGRTYIPGWTEVSQNAGVPDAVAITQMQDAGNVLATNGAAAGGLVVYSPTHRVRAAVTTISPWSKWAVLRSRRD